MDVNEKIKCLCIEWAEDHSHLQKLCLEAGYDAGEVYGDTFGVPGIQDLADMLFKRIPPNIHIDGTLSI
ncbi:MAG: hypothetical protein M0P12_01325 [Paludibacteraceae bacterium]|nr:hypothetical protein [Paludibacteraceae bacterium]